MNLSRQDKFARYALPTFKIILAGWALSYYLLPNTPFGHMALVAFINDPRLPRLYIHRWIPIFMVACIGGILIFGYRKDGLRNNIFIPIGVAVYLLPFLYLLLVNHPESGTSSYCTILIEALASGLLSALVVGRTSYVAWLLCGIALVQATYASLYTYLGISVFPVGHVQRAGGTFYQPNALATVVLICLPMSIVYFLKSSKSYVQTFWLLCIAIFSGTLVLTWYPRAVIALGLSLTLVLFRMSGRRAVLVCGFIFTLASTLLVCFQIAGGPDYSVMQRFLAAERETWHDGLIIVKNNWLIGVGPGTLDIPSDNPSLHPGFFRENELQPTNLPLLIAEELGLGGCIIVLAIAYKIWRIIQRNPDWAFASAWIAFAIFSLINLPSGTADKYYGNAIVGSLLGGTILLHKEEKPDELTQTEKSAGY